MRRLPLPDRPLAFRLVSHRPPRRSPMPSLHQDYPMPAWTAALALIVIVASGIALYAVSL